MKIKKNTTVRRRKIPRLSLISSVIFFYIIFFNLCFNPFPLYKKDIDNLVDGRLSENLDRGIIAIYINSSHVYVGWRLLEDDPINISFNLYRDSLESLPIKLNKELISQTTNFIDQPPSNETNFRYWVRPVVNSSELSPSRGTSILNNLGEDYISIGLNGNYTFQKIGIADLNGDGSYDYIIKQPNYNIDPLEPYLDGNWEPSQDTYKIEAYLSNGTFLWSKDLGWDIEQGIWYSPYVVYDFDGDGRAEIALKTGIGDHRDLLGRVQTGPEYLSIWDGMTGTEITRYPWPRRIPQFYSWNSRNQLGIAFLDGYNPSIIIARGTYGIMRLEAVQFTNNTIKNLWKWDTSQEYFFKYFGQGAHFMHCADVDSDGFDEVLLGSCVIDQNGKGLWSTGLQHPDHFYIGDIDPGHPGLEIYYGLEGILAGVVRHENDICLVDAATGKILWGIKEKTYHVHSRGLVSDIDPAYPGMECYSGESDLPKRWLHSANGTFIANEITFDIGLNPAAVYWDADLQRELLYSGRIEDYSSSEIHLSGISGYQVAWTDILGDWREEVIVSVEGEIRIYTTTIPAEDRRVCLMQDPIYRLDVAHNSMGYSQVPMTSYCLDTTGVVPSRYSEPEDNFYNFMLLIIILIIIAIAITTVIVIAFWLSKRDQLVIILSHLYKKDK
ncbi:MAG: silent information regulator protein Sir2 [Promethearchaeota archaeon]